MHLEHGLQQQGTFLYVPSDTALTISGVTSQDVLVSTQVNDKHKASVNKCALSALVQRVPDRVDDPCCLGIRLIHIFENLQMNTILVNETIHLDCCVLYIIYIKRFAISQNNIS